MPQTAVEWLESKFQKFLLYYEGNHKAEPYTIQELSNDFEQAKQKFQEQIIEAYIEGEQILSESDCKAQQYYTQTYSTRLQNETN